ncbi:MAG: helix-turn-helix transcriptional regulator [Bacteroidaceae bacterium]|nr:helix-turn-helix transcriptional regulator [Bacteroidaceae bacterium]
MTDDRTYTNQEIALLAAADTPPPVKHASVRKIELKDYMEKNFRSDYSMTKFARATGRSLSTFKRDFKKFSDLSPERWLTNRRLLAAYDLLRRGRRVTDVCFDVGFKNVSHFSAIFKKRFNMTPSQVRKLGSAEQAGK